jgi:selenide,water dikinase
MADPNLIVGMERAEDAGVYKLRDDLAIVQTLDFFTPIVDDPYTFGQIAAANALSDVYAMGGRPLTAMNIVCFPINTMDMSVLHDILRGGLDKLHEAGVTLVGGHSVEDEEMKYGLSVTGVIHPENVVRNVGAVAGDSLILTKPLGTGIINTAIKGEMADERAVAKVTECMTALNNTASELMITVGVHACTDVTGFGLLGHACEMIEGAEVGMRIDAGRVPFFEEAQDLAEMGMVPGGLHRNREFRKHMVDISESVQRSFEDVLYDPQTSGGLLICVPGGRSADMLERIQAAGSPDAAIIGQVIEGHKGHIYLK